MLRTVSLVFFALMLGACASPGYQTRAVLDSPPNVPRKAELDNVPFIEQSDRGYCGPSALAMALGAAGSDTGVEVLAQEVYQKQGRGSLQADLIAASRRRGRLVVQIEGLENLLKEVAAGHPVIVFENLALSWWPQWHYSVVVGYDLDAQELVRHSGKEAFLRESLNRFERGWQLGGYWGLVVLPPSELAAGAGEIGNLQAAAGLEQAGYRRESETAYRHILKRWPGSLGALIGLANVAYQRKDYRTAVSHLTRAVKKHPQSVAAKHNLAVAKKFARGG